MPRIDPQKLLNCLSVLLAPNGGIRSSNEVKRLAGLMAKFSKKLVSKCIYIQILKCTDTELLGQFMAAGGWSLSHMWLTDGILTKNWPLVQEILELLLLCPVDVQRLKNNSAPKLVKGLSKEGGNEGVRILATKLVEQWLKIVKGDTLTSISTASSVTKEDTAELFSSPVTATVVNKSNIEEKSPSCSSDTIFIEPQTSEHNTENDEAIDPLALPAHPVESIASDDVTSDKTLKDKDKTLVYKITVKDGKQVLAKIEIPPNKDDSNQNVTKLNKTNDIDIKTSGNKLENTLESATPFKVKNSSSSKSSKVNSSNENKEKKNTSDRSGEKTKDQERSKSKDHDQDKARKGNETSKRSSGKISTSSSHSSSKRHRSSSSAKSSSHKSSSRSHSSSHSSSRENDRKKSSSSKRSSSSSKDKDKSNQIKEAGDKVVNNTTLQAAKDQDTLAKVMPQSINKIGKIPKKLSNEDGANVNDSTNITKKQSISIEVRKDAESRPKTVKTFNSQFREHGLAEEAPPPPSRRGLKKPSSTLAPGTSIPSIIGNKRSLSPPASNKEMSLDKKLKIETTQEKPGAIKLIPPKAKPSLLVESDMFMDALSAATSKKDSIRKRKRMPSLTYKESVQEQQKIDKPVAQLPKEISIDAQKDTVTEFPSEHPTETAPLKFYQDTLEENVGKTDEIPKLSDISTDVVLTSANELVDTVQNEKNEKDDKDDDINKDNAAIKADEIETTDTTKESKLPGPGCGPDGPPGILTVNRRKGPKKQLKWRPQESLEDIRYFELDENERVNVTKTFVDMKQIERYSERDAFLMARKLSADDTMTEQAKWSELMIVDDVPVHPDGANSKERKIQSDRELTCLKALYFNRLMIPENPAEPDMEQYQITDPQIIPLEDVTGNPDAVNIFTNISWPEPKGSPPHKPVALEDTSFLNYAPYPYNSPNPWQTNAPPNCIPPFEGPPRMGNINNINTPSDIMNNTNRQPFGLNFMQSHGFNNFGPPHIDNNIRCQGPNRGGGNNSNWYRPNIPQSNWRPPMGVCNNNSGIGHRPAWMNRSRICKSFQKGYCRNGDKCNFLHPGINCPPF